MSNPHGIPSIPILPPLDLSSTQESDETTGLVHLSVPVDAPSVSFLQSPVPSFAESFSTALTSPIQDGEDILKRSLPSLYPSQSLKKSVSVDSFVHYARDTSSPPGSARGNILRDTGTAEVSRNSTSQPPWSGRLRGESLSSVRRDHDAPSRIDHDVDLYDRRDSTTPEQTSSRRPSLIGQDGSKSPILPKGHLVLPSRTRNNSNATAPSSPQEVGELTSHSSMSSLPPTTTRGTSFSNPGRTRSVSVGYNPSSSSKRIVMNTLPAFPQPDIPQSTQPEDGIVIAVIGKRGCGKSTVIRKGLPAGYNMVEVSRYSEDSEAAGPPGFVRRVGTIPEDPTTSPASPPRYLEIFELDVHTTDTGLAVWSQDLPKFDGLMICYDSSNPSSYEVVENILKLHHSTGLSLIVLACKSDLEHVVDPSDTLDMLKQYDTGLIEVSNATEIGREKMKQSFKYMLKAVLRQRGPEKGSTERNPASPSLLYKGSPWSERGNDEYPVNPTSQFAPTVDPLSINSVNIPESSSTNDHSDDTPSTTAQSPSWSQPTPDTSFNSELQSPQEDNRDVSMSGPEDSNHEHLDSIEHSPRMLDEATRNFINEKKNAAKERRATQYVELESILDKLLFLAVSGEDPTYITHFLLTYRRFTTPRSVLLAMQKRMRMLDNPCGDPMFACFAQMRICHFLEIWIRDFPHDFAVQGTMGALSALIKSIISKTHLLHYGSEFLPFLEQLPNLEDQDVAWAMKGEISDNDSDDSDNEDEEIRMPKPRVPEAEPSIISPSPSNSPKVAFPTRERKSSIPLPKSILPYSHTEDQSPKQQIKDLVKLAQDVLSTDSREIAEEITRTGVRQFMLIKPRDWLHYTFITISGKGKPTDNDPIVTFNIMSNHLADWVVSLILCHDRTKQRVRQIEKFVDIANKLRNMNNYSALRAFVAGINNAMDDPTTDYFKSKSPDASKNLMSWDVLLQQIRAHRAYRMALRNSKGGCIPALEVHMSDLIKAQEVNDDFKSDCPSMIHWGKFNMMGRFISTTLQCQVQCSNTTDYDFPERPQIAELFVKRPLMGFEMQKSRLKSDDDEYDDYRPPVSKSRPPTDIRDMRRIFFS